MKRVRVFESVRVGLSERVRVRVRQPRDCERSRQNVSEVSERVRARVRGRVRGREGEGERERGILGVIMNFRSSNPSSGNSLITFFI
jgi:hypothetical protein